MGSMQGVQARMLYRQNESNLAQDWLAFTSIFGLRFMPVSIIKSNCNSLIYSSLEICVIAQSNFTVGLM